VLLADIKYPGDAVPSVHGLILHAYDLSEDENEPMDDEDLLHDPQACMACIVQGLAKSKGSSHTMGTHPHAQLQNVAFL